MMDIESLNPELAKSCEPFILSIDQLHEVVERMRKEIEMGLDKTTKSRAVIKCRVTYVHDLPTGKEDGKYLALAIGHANYRFSYVRLGDGKMITLSNNYVITKAMRTGSGKDFFNKIAESMEEFIKHHSLQDEHLALCFSFAFPLKHVNIKKAILISWKKGFSCEGVVGNDICEMLQNAILRRYDLKVKVAAIVNDTTGTLMSCAFHYGNCRIGLIVDANCNASYVERYSNAQIFSNKDDKPHVIINTEWGCFGDNGTLDFVRNKYDRDLDKTTTDHGKQTYDKCVSSIFLGELVRLMMIDQMDKGQLFKGQDTEILRTPWMFDAKFLIQIENATGIPELLQTRFGLRHITEKDIATLIYICEKVTRRSAMLVACGLACLMLKIEQPSITIGVDGELYRYHPHYHELLVHYMTQLLPNDKRFQLVVVDGSDCGAVLVAAVSDAIKTAIEKDSKN